MNAQIPSGRRDPGAADFSRVAKEALVSRFRPGTLELVTDNPASGQTRPPALLLEPLGEFRCKTESRPAGAWGSTGFHGL